MNQIIIGLEAHDATGKTETSQELVEILGGSIYKVGADMKLRRREASKLISVLKKYSEVTAPNSDEYNLSQFLDACKNMDETYFQEKKEIDLINSKFIVMDRTWASHAAERYYQSSSYGHSNPYLNKSENLLVWPKGVVKPNITFEIKLIPDSVRVERMVKRSIEEGIAINEREEKLNSDLEYQTLLEIARRKLGCKRFVIRKKRQPIVCALRIAQTILGSSDCPPMDANLGHLQS
jgi:thymidylate kinase